MVSRAWRFQNARIASRAFPRREVLERLHLGIAGEEESDGEQAEREDLLELDRRLGGKAEGLEDVRLACLVLGITAAREAFEIPDPVPTVQALSHSVLPES